MAIHGGLSLTKWSLGCVYPSMKMYEIENRVTRRFEKNCPIFQKVAQTISKPKKVKISKNKAQLESQKYLHQTTFETLKYLQKTMF